MTIRCAMALTALAAVVAASSSPAPAQKSASFVLEERCLNSGGTPLQGTVLSSPGFRITLSSLGDALAVRGLTSASFIADVSLLASNAPPGEITNLQFTGPTTLAWDAEGSVGHYNLYRGLASSLSGLAYGACHDPLVPLPTAMETASPPLGAVYFYLVTAENRLAEEGTKGFSSDGTEREGTDCP